MSWNIATEMFLNLHVINLKIFSWAVYHEMEAIEFLFIVNEKLYRIE